MHLNNCIQRAANIDDLAGFAKSCLGDDEELGAPSGSSGIVFCRTKVETESLCIELNKRGIITRAYHAGLEVLFLLLSDIFCSYLLYQEVERVQVQELWMVGTVPVITATVSFKMGVDRHPSALLLIRLCLPAFSPITRRVAEHEGMDSCPMQDYTTVMVTGTFCPEL